MGLENLDDFLESQANENSLLDPDFNDEDNFVQEYNHDMDYEENLAKYYPEDKLPNLTPREDERFMLIKGDNIKGHWRVRTTDDIVVNPFLEKCFKILL